MINGTKKRIPQLNKPEYKVFFYHTRTGDILKYKFTNIRSAERFIDRLDPVKCRPTMYESTRIY